MEYSRDQFPFLNILIKKVNNQIETNIYYKPTDSKQYLLFNSCHPRHTRINVPYNLAKRICTIVSNESIRDIRLHELNDILLNRNYPPSLIDNALQRAKKIYILALRQTKPKNTSQMKVLPYISTHNPKNNEAYNIIFQNIPTLKKDARMNRILQTHYYKKQKTVQIIEKNINKCQTISNNNRPTVKKCGRSNCCICLNLSEGPEFIFKQGQRFEIKSTFTCASENLIYTITCSGCGENCI